jgi:hypothetical protein
VVARAVGVCESIGSGESVSIGGEAVEGTGVEGLVQASMVRTLASTMNRRACDTIILLSSPARWRVNVARRALVP